MAKKQTGKPEEQNEAKSVSRRNFLKHGAVAGVSAAALGGATHEASAQGAATNDINGTTRPMSSSLVRGHPECLAPSGRATLACVSS